MDELLAMIETLSLDAEQKTSLKNKMVGEVQKQKQVTHEKDQDNLKLKNVFKKLGKESGVEYETFVDELLTKMKDSDKTVEEKELSIQSVNEKYNGLSSQLEKALTDLSTIKTEKEQAVKTALDLKVSNALKEQFKDRVYGEKFVVDSSMSQNEYSISEDGNIMFGSGENKTDITTFAQTVLDNNKDILKAPQKDGNNSNSGDGAGSISERVRAAAANMPSMK